MIMTKYSPHAYAYYSTGLWPYIIQRFVFKEQPQEGRLINRTSSYLVGFYLSKCILFLKDHYLQIANRFSCFYCF
jgi:hypothetical protein